MKSAELLSCWKFETVLFFRHWVYHNSNFPYFKKKNVAAIKHLLFKKQWLMSYLQNLFLNEEISQCSWKKGLKLLNMFQINEKPALSKYLQIIFNNNVKNVEHYKKCYAQVLLIWYIKGNTQWKAFFTTSKWILFCCTFTI